MAFKSIERKREYDRVYNATHKEEIKRRRREYYQKNRLAIIQRTGRYPLEIKDIWLHECNRCKYKWISKKKEPVSCANPKCRSPYWNKPRVRKKKKGHSNSLVNY